MLLCRSHRCDVLDGVGHLGAVGLERGHGLRHGSGKGGRPFHVVHVGHDGLEDPVGRGEGANHLLGGGLGRLGRHGGHGGEDAHRLVAEVGQGRFHIVGGSDERRLVGTGPLVGEGFCGVLDGPEVLHAEGRQLAQGLLGRGGGGDQGGGHRHQGQSRPQHHGPLLDAVQVAGHPLAGIRHGGIEVHHGTTDALRVLRERILHRYHYAQSEIAVHLSPFRLLTFKIKLPLEGLDELTPDPERQRAGF